jgi:hypothetical protein
MPLQESFLKSSSTIPSLKLKNLNIPRLEGESEKEILREEARLKSKAKANSSLSNTATHLWEEKVALQGCLPFG